MSVQLDLWGDGLGGSEISAGQRDIRESLRREMRYLLTISANAGGRGQVSPAGIAHSLGVCLIEDYNMARGAGKGGKDTRGGALPRFVDVKLSAEQREAFLDWFNPEYDQTSVLRGFADSGYRVGITWSGEHNSYTVSATCRDGQSPNDGLCMTAFAGELKRAIALLWYKHEVVAQSLWLDCAGTPEQDFG